MEPTAVQARVEAAVESDLMNRIARFAATGSIEVTTHETNAREALVGWVPAGSAVYVTHTPNATLADVAAVACDVESWGFQAWPHIVARRIQSEGSLTRALEQMRNAGIARALLVAGDRSTPAGDFASTMDVLATGALAAAGFRSLAVAGYPEGHKRIGSSVLWTALREKQGYAEATGTRLHIVSQFGFDPGAIQSWDRQLAEHGIALPVHVGIAGPASLRTLIRFAMLCGIGASLNAIMMNLSALSSVRHLATSAEEMLLQVVRARRGALAARIVQPHFFSFGGIAHTARWLHAIRNGAFDIDPNGETLAVHS